MAVPTIAFLTALPLEFNAVRQHLENPHSKIIENRTYTIDEKEKWRIVLRQQHSQGNYQAARETGWLIEHFQPTYLFFIGVAGGIKNVELGNVVVATFARGYESIKVKDGVTHPRLHVEYSAHGLVEQAIELARNWRVKTWVCPIASGEKLVSDQQFLEELKLHCSDAVAVEMEAIGFLGSIRQHKGYEGIVIRGISDLIVGKNAQDDDKWQPIAAQNAAAFAFALLDNLPVTSIMTQTDDRIFYVPVARSEYFTGRELVLEKIQIGLQANKIMVLHGLGGIGKTQTLVKYAHQHRADYQAILWLFADTAENFSLNISRLAQELRLSVEGKNPEEIYQAVVQWLVNHSSWLLLIDNADDLMIIKEFLSTLKGKGAIIVTSRAAVIRPLGEPIEIEKMNENEGTRFLQQRTGYDEDATELVKLLDGLPLALDQAAAYLTACQMSFVDYIQLYQSEGINLLKERGELIDKADHPDPVTATWLLSFEKVSEKSELAIDILRQSAFLHSDGIVEEIFDNLDKKEFNDALKEILKYSLLKRDNSRKLLLIHRLVQAVLQAQLSTEEQKTIVTQVIDLLVAACPNDETDYMAWTKRRSEWLPNAREGQRWSQTLGLQTEAMGTLFNNMGYYLQHGIGDYPQALPLYQEVVKIFEQVLGKQHPYYASNLNNLAALYNSQGETEKALPLYQEALAIYEQVLGKQHPDYATSLNNLAELYRTQGEYEKALPLFQEALAIREQVLGKLHPSYATSLNNLAGLYDSQGEYEKALPLYQEALAIREQVLGKQHPNYASSLNNLAALYDSQSEYEKALPLYQEALAIREQVLGKQHPSYATSLNNLAYLYYSQGEYEKALPLYQEALAIREQVLGKQHPDYATSLNNLAELYYSQGEYEKALPLLKEALAIREQVLGKQHPDYATSLNNLAYLYYSQGETEKALPLYQEALAILVKVLGEKHPTTQTVKENYETCLNQDSQD